MNVAELRESLAKYPDDLEVMYHDDDHGYLGVWAVGPGRYPDWSPKIAAHMKSLNGIEPEDVVILE